MPEKLADVLRRIAGKSGSRPAVAEPGRAATYAELDHRSDQIAAALQRMGVAAGGRVGILRRKNIDTIAIIYGILKAGCAYAPLDPKIGPDRLLAILRHDGLDAMFTDPSLAARLKPSIEANLIPLLAGGDPDTDPLTLRELGPEARRPANGAGAQADPPTAYVLYTSGSTGLPKGVEHADSSALAFASWAADHFCLSSNDRLSCHAPLHFDLTTFDLFAALLKSSCVVLIPEELVIFPQRVADLVEREEITMWYSVPFALMQLVERGNLARRNLSALREIIFAGERFPPSPLRRLAELVPGTGLTNLFGPTETNVCTYYRVSGDDLASDDFCPIGHACPYASLAIVDEGGQNVSPGEVGELLVGGPSVMKGYLNRPALNEQAFVELGKGARFFRTGDRVQASIKGPLLFHGRLDRQVKVRGVRIELDEIEGALLNCEGVAAAAVWIECEDGGLDRIAAAVAASPGLTLMEDVLIRHLSRSLNQTAVPARIAVLDQLPRTPNGKIDRFGLTVLGNASKV
jgi:amino acid adenylation domain-containing protein